MAMFVKSMYLAVVLLMPLAFSMKLDGLDVPHHKMALAVDAAHPKMTLAVAGSDVKSVDGSDVKSLTEMETVFVRSDEVHRHSMDEISKTLTFPKAMDMIQHSTLANANSVLGKVTGLLSGSSQNLRAASGAAKDDGFGGIDGARKLLNSMIHESMTKYDAEISKCTDYYSKQCALMEVARGEISAANFVAANSRALILDAQAVINQMTKDIPATKQELKAHSLQCKTQLHKMNERLKVLMGDIAVMTMILKMSDCDAKGFVQTHQLGMMQCRDECTQKDYVTFDQSQLQSEMDLLKSSRSQEILSENFADMFADDDDDTDGEVMMLNDSENKPKKKKGSKKQPPAKKMGFNNPPVPKTKVPSNPCTDPNQGAPSAANKRAAKCTLKKSPQCYKLQGRFLQIQAGIQDDKDQLMEDIELYDNACKDTKKTLEASIESDGSLLGSSQTKLAAATEKESTAGEKGRQVATENEGYNADLLKQMKTCSTNYINFETELCALKKIRGDLFKKMVKGHKGFFQDCEVTKWVPEACTKKCAHGQQKLSRSVMSHPSGGAKCLPLAATGVSCNRSPCPVNCKLEPWGGWAKCSSKCGGGLQTRVRDVKQAMRYDGNPCAATSEAKQCNVASCEKNCVLHEWTKWTSCSKDCDGGSQKRQKMIKEPAEGAGKCAGTWAPERLEYKKCAMHRCKVPDANKVMKCDQSLDIVLVMDGTPKSGKAGWAAEQKLANSFVDAFTGKGSKAKPNFAVIHYTGPRTWSGVSKCTGKSTKKVDMEKDCRVKIASHFSEKTATTKATISGLQFAPGSKLLSLGLMVVQAEMALGRANRRSIVVVFIDGEPLSYRKTMLASHALRKKARLIYVVVAKFAPMAKIKLWSSRRWQENLVQVADATELAKAETGTHIIANICPKKFPKLKVKGPKKAPPM